MKLETAQKIIDSREDWRENFGYRVVMDIKITGRYLHRECFPEVGEQGYEPPIKSLSTACAMARGFAAQADPDKFGNVHVVYDKDYSYADLPGNEILNPFKREKGEEPERATILNSFISSVYDEEEPVGRKKKNFLSSVLGKIKVLFSRHKKTK